VAVSRLSHWTGWSLGVTPRAREWSRSHSTAGLIGVPFDWPANFLFIQLTHSDPDRESGVTMHCIWPLFAIIAHRIARVVDGSCARSG
jgi:hypothetical protein